jgi:hypothetical protein
VIDSSHRVATLHAIAACVDERAFALDPVQRLLPASDRVRDLTVSLGTVAAAEEPLYRVECLFELAVLVVGWLEDEQREQVA